MISAGCSSFSGSELEESPVHTLRIKTECDGACRYVPTIWGGSEILPFLRVLI